MLYVYIINYNYVHNICINDIANVFIARLMIVVQNINLLLLSRYINIAIMTTLDLLALIVIHAVHCERQKYFRINSGVHFH